MLIKTNQLLLNTDVSITQEHNKPTPLAVSRQGLWRLHLKHIDEFEPVGYIDSPMDDEGFVYIYIYQEIYGIDRKENTWWSREVRNTARGERCLRQASGSRKKTK